MVTRRKRTTKLSDIVAAGIVNDPEVDSGSDDQNDAVLIELSRFMQRVSSEGVDSPSDHAILHGAKAIFGSMLSACDKVTAKAEDVKEKVASKRKPATKKKATKKKAKKKAVKKKPTKKKAVKKSTRKKSTKKKATKKKSAKKKASKKKSTRRKTTKKKATKKKRSR